MSRNVVAGMMMVCMALAVFPALAQVRSEQAAFLEGLREDVQLGILQPQFCMTPGASPEAAAYVDEILALSAPGSRFNGTDSVRWKATSTNGGGLVRGQPITLTWSIVKDGLALSGPNNRSDLRSKFDAAFGSRAAWVNLLTQVFDEWSAKTGITFVKVSDDGAPFPSSPGKLGSCGDIRIGGMNIDGSGAGVLAYNYFPEGGDMVLDTANTNDVYKKPANNYRYLRNIVAHELGHGIGFDHVCPRNETKVMEGLITLKVDHSALDDIANGNRKYGDPYEKGSRNDIVTKATPLGVVGNVSVGTGSDPSRRVASLDATTDVDFYAVTVVAGSTISARVIPLGAAYEYKDDNGNGCGSNFDTLVAGAVINLNLQLISTDGFTVLAQAGSRPAGQDEFLISDPVPSTGTYFVRVYTNDPIAVPDDRQVQLYTLSLHAPGEELSEIPVSNAYTRALLIGLMAILGCVFVHRRGRIAG